MQTAINAFLANPTPATLTAARNAWKTARVPYLQTEGLRFGNAIVDEWEPKVNAWPLDEGLIDYVDDVLRHDVGRESALHAERHRQPPDPHRRAPGQRVRHQRESAARDSDGAGRRSQCRDRLSRDRIPAVGPGSARHRTGRRRTSGDRLQHDRVHARQLRPPRGLSANGDRSSGRRSRRDDGRLGAGRQGAHGAGGQGHERRSCDDPHRHSAACPTASWPASA